MKKILIVFIALIVIASPLQVLVAEASDTHYYVGTRRSSVSDPFAPCENDICLDPCEWSDCYSDPCDSGCETDPCGWFGCDTQEHEGNDPAPTNENENENTNTNTSGSNNTNVNENTIIIKNYINTGWSSGRDDDDEDIISRRNRKPVFTSEPVTFAREGALYTYVAQADDADGEHLTYSLLQNPSGMTIGLSSGVIRWTPSRYQGGIAYEIIVAAFDGTSQAVQTYQLYVVDAIADFVAAKPAQPNGQVASANIVEKAEASDRSVLRAYNIRVDTDELGNSVVSWDTTKPTRGRVLYGRASQGDRNGIDFTGAAQYEFATPNTPETSTSHRAVLGQLESERVYYFRVVSFAGDDIVVSSERSFVQLGTGKTLNGESGFASVIGTLGSFVTSPWFLFLAIIIIVLVIVFRRRNQQEIIAHAPVETHVAAHH